MSSQVPPLPPRGPSLSLGTVIYHGKEAFLNRWQRLFTLSLVFLALPRVLAVVLVSGGSTRFAEALRMGALDHGDFIDGLADLASKHLQISTFGTAVSVFLVILGILALAQTSWDYFDQRTFTTQGNVIYRASKVLLRKGLGALTVVILALVPTAMFSLLHVILVCLLVELPVELVASSHGGMKSALQTIFLRYSAKGGPRWTVFSCIMTIGGAILSMLFLSETALIALTQIDIILGAPSTFWTQTVHLPGGGAIALSHLVIHGLRLLVDSAVFAVGMPFVAAVRFHSTRD